MSGACCTDGYGSGTLAQGTDGNFSGTNFGAGSNGDGTIFKIAAGGQLTTLHSFDGADGSAPYAGLMQATNGDFYGTTSAGGTIGDGTVFSLSAGLGPFVETSPTSGKVGTAVIILGNNLTSSIQWHERLHLPLAPRAPQLRPPYRAVRPRARSR